MKEMGVKITPKCDLTHQIDMILKLQHVKFSKMQSIDNFYWMLMVQ